MHIFTKFGIQFYHLPEAPEIMVANPAAYSDGRRQWHPTPVFLPGESQGWGSLVGCRLWGHTESDTTDTT